MNGKMALVKMTCNILLLGNAPHIAGLVHILLGDMLLGDKESHRRSLRLIVLLGDIQHVCADGFGNITEYLCETVGIILLVDILDIVLLLPLALCIADIIYIKA